MKKTLPITSLVSLTTRHACGSFDEMHEAAEHVMGHPIWTHEFADPDLWDTMSTKVLEQFPDLPTRDNWDDTVDPGMMVESVVQRARLVYGDEVEVEQGTSIRTDSPIKTLLDIQDKSL